MRKFLIILFFGAVLLVVVFLLIRYPEVFKQIYIWLIGLFGIITWPFRKLWNWMNSEDELKEIEQSNEQLKTELAQIKKNLALAQRKLEEERRQNKIKIEDLQNRIRQEDLKAQDFQKKLAESRAQPIEDVGKNLTPEEKEFVEKLDFGF